MTYVQVSWWAHVLEKLLRVSTHFTQGYIEYDFRSIRLRWIEAHSQHPVKINFKEFSNYAFSKEGFSSFGWKISYLFIIDGTGL